MAKLSKTQMRRKVKEDFLEKYSAVILQNCIAVIYPHFIKVELAGKEYDYYPGAEMKNADGFGRINDVSKIPNVWSDLEHKQFLALLQIDPNYDVFSSREEDIGFSELGLFNDDLD